MSRLRVHEIFYSLQGESATVGVPTIFIRLTGCPLRCGYCDTEYAFKGGDYYTIEQLLEKIQHNKTQYVTVTGGEPLAQKSCLALLETLADSGYQVSLETSGALDISQVDSRVMVVMDLKTPGSGEVERNHYQNIEHLKTGDQVKFVICDRQDFDWAAQEVAKRKLTEKCEVLFSPSYQQLDATTLADWVLEAQLPVRFQIQLHKYLWGDVSGV